MGVFSKIFKTHQVTPQAREEITAKLATLNQDARLHARYLLRTPHLAQVQFEDGLVGSIRDISYGGVAVELHSASSLPTSLPPFINARLVILDQSVACRLGLVRLVPLAPQAALAGFTMTHENADTLLFLREFIEPLRCSASLVHLAPEVRQERYRSNEWVCMRGDGPSDLVAHKDASGHLTEALWTFRRQNTYCEISYRNGQLKTGKTSESSAGRAVQHVGSAPMHSSTDLDRSTLRQAVYLMQCIPESDHQAMRPMVEAALRALGTTP